MKLQARGDWVLLRIVQAGISKGGVALPETAAENQKSVVVSVGDQVKHLKAGDEVKAFGTRGVDFFEIPRVPDHVICKDKNVALVVEEE